MASVDVRCDTLNQSWPTSSGHHIPYKRGNYQDKCRTRSTLYWSFKLTLNTLQTNTVPSVAIFLRPIAITVGFYSALAALMGCAITHSL